MSMRTWLFLISFWSASSVFADVAPPDYPLRIKVITIEAQALDAANQVPKDCDLQNYSAYCNESRNTSMRSVMLVRDTAGETFKLTCNTDSRWAKCSLLKVGQTYDAREEKQRMAVLLHDKKGRERKHIYQLISALPASEAHIQNAPPPASPHVEPPPPPVQAESPQYVTPREVPGETVKVNFTSTPSGAEITVDGEYSGNTPSIIALSPGVHNVVLSQPGFAVWKRELKLSEGSQVNLSATLEKTP